MSMMPFKANAAGRHHIPRLRHPVTNWPDYDSALRQRGILTGWFTEEAIAAWRGELSRGPPVAVSRTIRPWRSRRD